MDWIEIEIKTTSAGVEPLTGLILMAGIPGLVVDDPKDIQEYLAGSQAARWDYADEGLLKDPERETAVRAYTADNDQGRRQREDLLQSLRALSENDREKLYGSLEFGLRRVRDEDWANNWKAFFKPFPVGEKLIVKPTWEPRALYDGRIILEIDPGSSFGTGQHDTTRLCLEMMEKYVNTGMKILDIGCGSGILMIAGLLLGAGYATGVDVDENALRTAEENLKQNGIRADRFKLCAGDLSAEGEQRRVFSRREEKADLVVVNIVADVILGLAPYFSAFLKADGLVLLSGIIDERREEVIDRLIRSGFELKEDRRSGGWNALLFGLYSP